MQERYTEHTRILIDGVLSSPGETTPRLRQAVETQAEHLSGCASSQTHPVPHALERYLTKVVLDAYKITDQDIEALREAGYSEAAIFEVTVSAALGAGLARLEIGQRALQGGNDATHHP